MCVSCPILRQELPGTIHTDKRDIKRKLHTTYTVVHSPSLQHPAPLLPTVGAISSTVGRNSLRSEVVFRVVHASEVPFQQLLLWYSNRTGARDVLPIIKLHLHRSRLSLRSERESPPSSSFALSPRVTAASQAPQTTISGFGRHSGIPRKVKIFLPLYSRNRGRKGEVVPWRSHESYQVLPLSTRDWRLVDP